MALKFFFQKITKNRAAPRPSLPPAAGGSAPRPLFVVRLSYTSLLNTSPNLDVFTF